MTNETWNVTAQDRGEVLFRDWLHTRQTNTQVQDSIDVIHSWQLAVNAHIMPACLSFPVGNAWHC